MMPIKRLVYMGTPEFAVPTLDALVAAGYEVVSVVSQPDRPKGRSQALSLSPVKQRALQLGLSVFQPERVRRPAAVEHLRALAPDAMVVVGYGQIIPQSVLDIPPFGIINVHASLLPMLRGAAPVQWAIARGHKTTGVTTMRIDSGLDTGAMLLKATTEIGPEENAMDLGQRLALIGATLLIETLRGLDAGTIIPERQDDSQATLAPIIKKETGLIDWSQTAQQIHDLARGLQPWPGAYTTLRGRRLHVWKSRVGECAETPPARSEAGVILESKNRVFIACGPDGARTSTLELLEVQTEGRKRMPAADFAHGQRMEPGERLGVGV